jgi:predicted O-linked N-acetylglucosamine transferase (SPINDLY family)
MCASNSQGSNEKLVESKKIQEAISLLQSGQLTMVQKILAEVIYNNPKNDEALHLQGLVSSQQNQLPQAFDLISQAIAINPKNSTYYSNRGEILRLMEKPKLAIEDLNLAISIDPKTSSLFFNRAVAYHHLKDYVVAIDNYQTALGLGLKNFQIYYYLGNIYAELAEYNKAEAFYQESLKLNQQNASAWVNLGVINDKRQMFQEAVECYRKSLSLNPGDAITYFNLGKALCEMKLYLESIDACRRSIEINPSLAPAYANLADALTALKLYPEAVAQYAKAISLDPQFGQAYFNCANVFTECLDFRQAITCLDSAIKINPLNPDAFYNRAVAKNGDKKIRSSLDDLECALSLKPGMDFVLGDLLIGYLQLGEWAKFQEIRRLITEKIKNPYCVANPLQLMAVFDSLDYLRSSATLLINKRYLSKRIDNPPPPKHSKIRIGYFSKDFKVHPVSYLLAEVFEQHNRDQFEIYAFSFSKAKPDAMTDRISKTVDYYYDVNSKTNKDIIKLARSLNLDIAIDLGIFTAEQLDVFKEGIAPVQVNYLGYAGTSGAPYIDYIIADQFTIPDSAEDYYSEKIVRLPCFMPREAQVKPSDKKLTRAEAGLPESGFVFCCTSGYGKILPETFAVWMNILKQVPGSCLWLGESGDLGVTDKIRSHAEKLGINASRLVFAKRLDSPADYLSRLGLADLFLDTFPYGAHTLSNDALWAGVPVLTRIGETFASRVAGSFLTQLQLPELITTSFAEYESRAVSLGNNPERLVFLKQKLIKQRDDSLVFNVSYYTKKLEESFKAMRHLSLNKESKRNITIKP